MQKVGAPWTILTQPMRYGHQLSNECRLDEVFISHGSGENLCRKMYIKRFIVESEPSSASLLRKTAIFDLRL